MGEPPMAAVLEMITTTLPGLSGVISASLPNWNVARTSVFQEMLNSSQVSSWTGFTVGVAPALSTRTSGRIARSDSAADCGSATSSTRVCTPVTSALSRSRFSTRTRQVDAKEKQLAMQWELRFGRAPTVREMLFIRHTARDYSRKAKDEAQIDWDAEAEKWDGTIGGRLAEVAQTALGRWQPGAAAPGRDKHEQAIRAALARVQREHSTWTKADLMKVLGSMG